MSIFDKYQSATGGKKIQVSDFDFKKIQVSDVDSSSASAPSVSAPSLKSILKRAQNGKN